VRIIPKAMKAKIQGAEEAEEAGEAEGVGGEINPQLQTTNDK